MPQPRQPFLHHLECGLAAPTQVWSASDGQIGRDGQPAGVQGVLHADVRVLSVAELLVDGLLPEHIATVEESDGTRFVSLHRSLDGSRPVDEVLRLDRVREVLPGRVAETIAITSTGSPQQVELSLRLGADLASIAQIRVGASASSRPFDVANPRSWGDDQVSVRLESDAQALETSDDGRTLILGWVARAGHGLTPTLSWSVEIADRTSAVVPATADAPTLARPSEDQSGTAARDRRLAPWVARSVQDLNALRMATREAPSELFFAAGAPWYLTLFGRDSLWAARMVLPLDSRPAVGTLRTLARLAGTEVDVDSAQEPGKIPHEVRRGTYAFGETSLPPLYYGTIDATPLWICLLHDLWRRGDQNDVVGSLLDPLAGALDWIVTYGDADGDGFLEYIDRSGHGLANQGWKDSADSVRFADGRIAAGPVALCEVQGYAYEALRAGADLLEAFERPGAERYREWATRLAERFRASFWCGTGAERYPALALDGSKERVDSLTSNIGHLLGTGLLSADEELAVARRVATPELDSGLGLRTMSSADGGYNPLSYHCGSVWPHDTAIVIAGLVRAGLADYADGLIEGLLRASVAFRQRLPELWSGEGRPVPYPAACRPQAWSAAAAVVVNQALTQ